jgi:hypothetical protein
MLVIGMAWMMKAGGDGGAIDNDPDGGTGDASPDNADTGSQGDVTPQFGDQGYVETEYYDGSQELVTRRDDGSVVYDGDPDFNQYFPADVPEAPAAPASPKPGPTSVAHPDNAELVTPPASIATLQPVLSDAEREYFNANPDKWLEAQELIASRVANRSETSMLASNSSYTRLQQQAPALMNIIGHSVQQNLANLTPELRVREDAADIALLMAVQTEVVNKKGSALDVMKRYVAVMEGASKPAAPPRAPAAPIAPVRRMPGASPNSAPRTSPSRQRPGPTVGVGLNLNAAEMAIMAADTEGLI